MKKSLLIFSVCGLLGLAGCFKVPSPSSASDESSSNIESISTSMVPSSDSSSSSSFSSSVETSNSSKSSSSQSSSSSVEKDHDWTDERDVTYEHKIEKPSEPVHDFNELMAISDYYAFYKQESFDVQIANDYEFENTVANDWDHESVCLYDSGELMNGVMGFATTYTKNKLHFDLDIYHNAYIDTDPQRFLVHDAGYQETKDLRPDSYDNFATEDDSLPIADVYSTQQLWYAAQYGYKINPLPNSPAETYYNKAKAVLRDICDDYMSDMEKYRAIFDYVVHHAVYDYGAIDLPTAPDEANYPDYYGAQYKGYFIEGFFDNGLVVCDGFAKVTTLLGSMEGLDIVRATGNNDKQFVRRDTMGHAFLYIKINGTTYLSDPTWSYVSVDGIYEGIARQYFLTNNRDHDEYIVRGFDNYKFGKTFINPYSLYFSVANYEVDGVTESLVNPSSTLLEELMNQANTHLNPASTFEIAYKTSTMPSADKKYIENNGGGVYTISSGLYNTTQMYPKFIIVS